MNIKAPLLEKLEGKNLIVFDGECVLCSGSFSFIIKADKEKQFYFATAQSDFGEALYQHFGLKAEDYDTSLVILNGRLYERLYAFFACMKLLGWPYMALAVFEMLPNRFLDWSYYKIARNRYQLFGKKDSCIIPSSDLKDRFING